MNITIIETGDADQFVEDVKDFLEENPDSEIKFSVTSTSFDGPQFYALIIHRDIEDLFPA